MDHSPDFDDILQQGGLDPPISDDFEVGGASRFRSGRSSIDSPRPSEAFQMLADEVRVRIVLELFSAESNDGVPVPFSSLQSAIGMDDSARFAYHVRQLVDHFVERGENGYALTNAGRRAAIAVLDGTFTNGNSTERAS